MAEEKLDILETILFDEDCVDLSYLWRTLQGYRPVEVTTEENLLQDRHLYTNVIVKGGVGDRILYSWTRNSYECTQDDSEADGAGKPPTFEGFSVVDPSGKARNFMRYREDYLEALQYLEKPD